MSKPICDDCFCDGCAGPGKCRCIHANCSHAERSEVVSAVYAVEHEEFDECEICHVTTSLRDGCDPTPICDNCAQEIAAKVRATDGGARELEQEIEEIVKKYEPDFPFVKLEEVRTRCRAEARICMRAALRLAMERKAGR